MDLTQQTQSLGVKSADVCSQKLHQDGEAKLKGLALWIWFQFVSYPYWQGLLSMFLRAQHGAHAVTQREWRTLVSYRPGGIGDGGNPARPWSCS